MQLLTTLLAFAVTLGLLIIVHEFGHFWVAKKCGVKVLRFSFGFGKPLFKFVRKGDPDKTEWVFCPLPLGGYVRMLDERDPACLPIDQRDQERTFNSQSVYRRLAIVLAGPFANLMLAVLLYTALNLAGTNEPLAVLAEPAAQTQAASVGIQPEDRVLKVGKDTIRTFSDLRFALMQSMGQSHVPLELQDKTGQLKSVALNLSQITLQDEKTDPLAPLGFSLFIGAPKIVEVLPETAAQKTGLLAGDEVLSLNGRSLRLPVDFVNAIKQNPGTPMQLALRDKEGSFREVVVIPDAIQEADGSKIGRIGARIGADIPMGKVQYGPVDSLLKAFDRTWETASFSVRMFGKMLLGEVSLKNISGPVTIADYAGQSARIGLASFISFLALVSISLGVLNLLPIPMLDGGHVLYYLVEIVRGRPVSEQAMQYAQKFGIVVILGLTFLALFNDITRLLS